jgi:hypothetical protein
MVVRIGAMTVPRRGPGSALRSCIRHPEGLHGDLRRDLREEPNRRKHFRESFEAKRRFERVWVSKLETGGVEALSQAGLEAAEPMRGRRASCSPTSVRRASSAVGRAQRLLLAVRASAHKQCSSYRQREPAPRQWTSMTPALAKATRGARALLLQRTKPRPGASGPRLSLARSPSRARSRSPNPLRPGPRPRGASSMD